MSSRRVGLRVLAVDVDPQGNLSDYFDVPADASPTLADVLAGQAKAADAIYDGTIIPANLGLAESELVLGGKMGREMTLRRALKDVKRSYDIVLIDCPPSLGLLTVNAVVAADQVLISTEAQYFSLQGVEQALEVIEVAKENLHQELEWLGVVLNIADLRTIHSREALQTLRDRFGDRVFNSVIRSSIRYAESAERGVSILDYRPELGADYLSLAEEVLERLGLEDERARVAAIRRRARARLMAGDDLLFRSASAQAALVRSGEVSARELVEASLARIEALDGRVNAFTLVDAEGALAAADAIAPGDQRPFAGVPIGIKDLAAPVAGLVMSNGSDLYGDYTPDYDANVVRRIRDAGFVIVGKTNTPELGIVPVSEPRRFGPSRNPWDLDYTPGGSSGGSGAAVAAGMVPIAHGSDGGGSIRIPAACCGLVGLKPSRGRVSRGPDLGDAVLSTDGMLTRTVEDCARSLDVIAGYEPGDATWAPPPDQPFASALAEDPGRLRIGLVTKPPIEAAVDPICERAARDAAELLSGLGHEVSEVDPPWSGGDQNLLQLFTVLYAANIGLGVAYGGMVSGREPQARGRGAPHLGDVPARAGAELDRVHGRAVDAPATHPRDHRMDGVLRPAADPRAGPAPAAGGHARPRRRPRDGGVRPHRAVHAVHGRLERHRPARHLAASVPGRRWPPHRGAARRPPGRRGAAPVRRGAARVRAALGGPPAAALEHQPATSSRTSKPVSIVMNPAPGSRRLPPKYFGLLSTSRRHVAPGIVSHSLRSGDSRYARVSTWTRRTSPCGAGEAIGQAVVVLLVEQPAKHGRPSPAALAAPPRHQRARPDHRAVVVWLDGGLNRRAPGLGRSRPGRLGELEPPLHRVADRDRPPTALDLPRVQKDRIDGHESSVPVPYVCGQPAYVGVRPGVPPPSGSRPQDT